MQRARGNAAVAALGLALFGAAGVGCSLILDFDDPPGPPDAAVIDAIPAAACDFGEPNDDRTMAFPLTAPVAGQTAGICDEGDRDFYSLTVPDGATVTIDVLFSQQGGRGDLDMRLLDANGDIVARSLSADDDEGLVCPTTGSPPCPALVAGNYFIEVFGFDPSVRNGYTLSVTVEGGTVAPDAGVDAM